MIILIILVVTIFTFILHKILNKARNDVVLIPPGLPFIGDLIGIASAENLPVYLWKLSEKYAPLMQLKLGSKPLIVVSSPKLIEEVMKTQDLSFCGRAVQLGQKKLSYNRTDMVFSPYGERWRELRKITAVHLFSVKKHQLLRPIREDEISRLISKISSFCHACVNVSEMAMALGSSLICRIVFGKRDDEIGKFDELMREAQAVMTAFFVSDYFPACGWVDKVFGSVDRVERIFCKLDKFYQEMIDEHLDGRRVKAMDEDEDILDVLIKIKESESSSIRVESKHC